MDKYEKVVKNNIFEFSFNNSRLINNGSPYSGTAHYDVKLSCDKIYEFIMKYYNKKFKMPFKIILYDEDIIDDNNIISRRRLLEILNEEKIYSIELNLSDSALYHYNLLMNEIGWKHENVTNIKLTLDRHPKEKKKNDLNLNLAKGKILIPEEKLLWLSTDTLIKLQGKVDENKLTSSYKLKWVNKEFYDFLIKNFYIEKFNDYDKLYIAYEYLKQILKIGYAYKYVEMKNGIQVLKKPRPNSISEPYGTYVKKEGVCEGQARLLSVLLNNHYMNMDATMIGGKYGKTEHAWTGAVIDDKLYECCSTMLGPFKDLSKYGYVPNEEEAYPKLYERSYLTENQINEVRNHVKQLKK